MLQMSLEDIMLREVSQTQKDKYCYDFKYEIPRVLKFTETGGRAGIARGSLAGGTGSCVYWVSSFSLGRGRSSGDG